MNKIKVRAWDKRKREFYYAWGENSGIGGALWLLMFPNVTEKEAQENGFDIPKKYDWHEQIIFNQYTGINDKNGTEIYDGSIIKFSERSINGFVCTHTCRVFQSENGAWRVEGHPDFDTSYRTRRELYQIRKKCEVIGNVYENPELLKEE